MGHIVEAGSVSVADGEAEVTVVVVVVVRSGHALVASLIVLDHADPVVVVVVDAHTHIDLVLEKVVRNALDHETGGGMGNQVHGDMVMMMLRRAV